MTSARTRSQQLSNVSLLALPHLRIHSPSPLRVLAPQGVENAVNDEASFFFASGDPLVFRGTSCQAGAYVHVAHDVLLVLEWKRNHVGCPVASESTPVQRPHLLAGQKRYGEFCRCHALAAHDAIDGTPNVRGGEYGSRSPHPRHVSTRTRNSTLARSRQ
jgi:hypothetical protein